MDSLVRRPLCREQPFGKKPTGQHNSMRSTRYCKGPNG
jgi:hypothetical protein